MISIDGDAMAKVLEIEMQLCRFNHATKNRLDSPCMIICLVLIKHASRPTQLNSMMSGKLHVPKNKSLLECFPTFLAWVL